MKLSAVMLLLGSAYAYSTKQHIANEVAALESLVGAMEEPSPNAIFAQMIERKEELQYLAANHPDHNKRYASELNTLASMVDLVEEQNFNEVLSLISNRKDKLVKDLASLKDDETNEEEGGKGKKDDDKEDDAEEEDASEATKKAYEAYNKKLNAFYDNLPNIDAGTTYKANLAASAKVLQDAVKAYEKKAGSKLAPMNADAFNALVKKQKETQAKLWKKVEAAEDADTKATVQAEIAIKADTAAHN